MRRSLLTRCERVLVNALKEESRRMVGSVRGCLRLYRDWEKGFSSHPLFAEYVSAVMPIGAALMEIRAGRGMVIMERKAPRSRAPSGRKKGR